MSGVVMDKTRGNERDWREDMRVVGGMDTRPL